MGNGSGTGLSGDELLPLRVCHGPLVLRGQGSGYHGASVTQGQIEGAGLHHLRVASPHPFLQIVQQRGWHWFAPAFHDLTELAPKNRCVCVKRERGVLGGTSERAFTCPQNPLKLEGD